MELFSKIYNRYFTVIGSILHEAQKKPLTRKELEELCQIYGYGESAYNIVPRLLSGEWPLLEETADHRFTARLNHTDRFPMTRLQKAWLAALLSDERIGLFFTDEELDALKASLFGVEPLFDWEDFHYFDRSWDGDSFSAPAYRETFRKVLQAATRGEGLRLSYENSRGRVSRILFYPFHLEYSEKDHKFRTDGLRQMGSGHPRLVTLNLSRIQSCESGSCAPLSGPWRQKRSDSRQAVEPAVIEISGERNSLERCMLHFAAYEKKTEYLEDRDVYRCSIYYPKQDETELLIQILSFGPVIRVLGPEPFLNQVKDRVRHQYELLHGIIS